MKIAFVYLPGRIKRIGDSLENGRLRHLKPFPKYHPSEFFYGAFELQEKGHDVGLFEVIEKPRRSLAKFLAEKLLLKRYLPVKTYAGIIDAVHFLLEELSRYDVIVATTPGIAFSLAIWKKLGLFHKPIAGIQCGILNYSMNRVRVFFTRKLLSSMLTQLYGVGEFGEIVSNYGVSEGLISVNCFGVDLDFWKQSEKDSDAGYFLAVGNDALRDFDTLITAAQGTDEKIIILTKRLLPSKLPENVSLIHGAWNSQEINDCDLRDLYQKATAITVPLMPSLQPSGQSVTLQAMACAKPVILTETQGLWERGELQDRKNVMLVPPLNVDAWINAINELDSNNVLRKDIGVSARKYVEENANIQTFADRMEWLCVRAIKLFG